MIDFDSGSIEFLRECSPDALAEWKADTIAKMPVLNDAGRAMMARLDPFNAPRLANAIYRNARHLDLSSTPSKVESFLGVRGVRITAPSTVPSLEDF